MADDLERLVAQFDADVSRFEKQMTKMGVAFQKQADGIERQQKDLTAKLNSGWTKLNFGGFQKALLGGLSLAALGSFINKTTELTDSILKMSHATGLSTDTFQEWSIVAKKNEVDQDALVTSIERFTKNLGDAQLGTGQFAKILSDLGVSAKGTVEDVFLRFIDAANKIQSPTQRAAVLAQAFGKGWADAAGFINLGSDAIRKASVEAKNLGQVIGSDTIKKIDDLSDAWTSFKAQLQTIGAEALGGFADEFRKFAGDVNSPEFKNSMKEFGESLAKIAGLLVKIAPALPAITGAFIGSRFGPIGAVLGGAAGAISSLPDPSKQSQLNILQKDLKNFQEQLRSQQSLPPWAQWVNGPYSAPELIKMIDATKKKIAELMATPVEVRGIATGRGNHARTGIGGGPNNDLTGALIPPDFLNPVSVTPAVRPDEDQTFKAQQDIIKAGQDQVDQYNEQISLLGKVDGAAAAAAFKQEALNHLAQEFGTDSEAYREGAKDVEYFAKQIEDAGNRAADAQEKFDAAAAVSDEIRSGLSDVGTAALHGFKSAEQAAGQFLQRLAEMILQLYVIKPLLESILGKQGTVIGGGGFFSFLGDIGASLIGGSSGGGASAGGAAGFSGFRAKGGAVKPGTWAIAGENGPEPVYATGSGAVVLPNSSLRMPSIPRPSAASAPIISVSIPVDARGAQEGVADQIDRKLRAVAPAIVQAAVSQSRKEFPSNMKRSMRDTM